MDFTCIVLFLALYHLKPQEWSSIFAQIRFVQLVMMASLVSLFMRERSLKPKDFFRTPHDWAMYAFCAWIAISSPTPVGTFKETINRLIFYVVIVQTLTNWERVRKFMGWWTAMLAITAFLALGGEYFWDPLNSHDLTHGAMKGRLVLNLSMVNNPNALAHTLAPTFSLLYYFCIWKRPLFMKQVGIFALALPLWAIFLTESKGGYFVAAAVIMATLTFGRPKIVQIIIITVMLAAGTTAFYKLPRMGELQKTKTDDAIQGRIQAFTYGKQYYDGSIRGVGQGQFIPRLLHDHHYYKASHSTYVQTGAELGPVGLFLFLLVMWCNLRTLLFAKTFTPDQERIRRILFVLVASYIASSWMVDFAYRATFFMMSAAVAAFHRHLYRVAEEDEKREREEAAALPVWRTRGLQPSLAGDPSSAVLATTATSVETLPATVPKARAGKFERPVFPWERGAPAPKDDEEPVETVPTKFWNRIGVFDIIATLAWLYATAFLWEYAIQHV